MKSTKLAVLLMSIAIAAIPPMFTSCSSGDEEEWNSPNDDWDNENNGNSDPTYELVKKNISASARCQEATGRVTSTDSALFHCIIRPFCGSKGC